MSDDLAQSPFAGFDDFVDNPEPRCACLLLLDTSTSMRGPRIDQLNEGLRSFKEELAQDSLAMKRVEIATVTFGPVRTHSDFQTADVWQPPELVANGDTPIGSAIVTGLELLRARKAKYRENAIEIFRPWVFLITDGGPTDSWSQAATMVREGEAAKGFSFFAIGVEDANLDVLRKISVRDPVKLSGLRFKEMFAWLSSSLSSVSASQPGTGVALQAPTGWTEV